MLERISRFFKKNLKSKPDATHYIFGPSEHSLTPAMINRKPAVLLMFCRKQALKPMWWADACATCFLI